jgi:thioredoxin 1
MCSKRDKIEGKGSLGKNDKGAIMNELEKIRKRKMEDMLSKMKYPGRPIDVHEGDFDETIRKYPLVLVDFWAEWCPPCRVVGSVIEELARELQGKVVFGKLDVGNNQSIAQKFGVSAIPTLIIFKKGEPVDKIMGAVPKMHIMETLNRYMQ